MLIDQQHAQVVNICAGRPGEDQAVRALERVISVVIGQHVGDGNALRIQRGFGCAVYITARRVGRAVCAVRTDGEDSDVRKPCDSFGRRERQLLVAAAQLRLAVRKRDSMPRRSHCSEAARQSWRTLPVTTVSTLSSDAGRAVCISCMA